MPYIPENQNNIGLFLGTTNIWEISRIQDVDFNSEEGRLLLVRLYQNIADILNALSAKDTGYYVLQQFVNGQQFFSIDPANPNNLRPDYRLTLNLGPISAGVNTFAHNISNITSAWTFTRIYGTATDSVGLNFYPIGTGGATAGIITINVNATNVVITNNTGVSFTRCIVVLEFLKY